MRRRRRARLEKLKNVFLALRPFLESYIVYCYMDKRESDMVIDDVRKAQKDDASSGERVLTHNRTKVAFK